MKRHSRRGRICHCDDVLYVSKSSCNVLDAFSMDLRMHARIPSKAQLDRCQLLIGFDVGKDRDDIRRHRRLVSVASFENVSRTLHVDLDITYRTTYFEHHRNDKSDLFLKITSLFHDIVGGNNKKNNNYQCREMLNATTSLRVLRLMGVQPHISHYTMYC